ncbi:GSCOCG00001043001-RA-CDS [Cotesia congregata]|uniref:Similar to Npc2a: NPC intracellular cholesterol transporter 2 homolog a (Drosophila melanogaster) n=1 Tax=Cotesia congregata TaxID=51543 RepID=A0A8J2MMF8_COTCN|nr:GSCOCG00001043001-RA-CDS [Cotesia congregata]CAG5096017.1 Similar to Npc2a: NPC intracellular cholesterol transporter 2 homolog a (Drosophila melanogaster) [Cotesia congregata]
MYRITLGLVLYLAVSANAVFQNCGSKIGSYISVNVSNCDPDASICTLTRGKDVSINIKFELDKDIERVNSVVHGVIGGAPLPFPIAHPNACEASGLKCPMTKDGGPYEYKTNLHVESYFPKLKVDVKWELKDEFYNNIICVLIPSQLK